MVMDSWGDAPASKITARKTHTFLGKLGFVNFKSQQHRSHRRPPGVCLWLFKFVHTKSGLHAQSAKPFAHWFYVLCILMCVCVCVCGV